MATQGHILDANTIALWRMDEASGGATDLTGVYTLPVIGTPPPSAAGKIGGARGAFSVSKYFGATVNAGMMTAYTGNWTLESWAWVDPAAGASQLTLWSMGNNAIGLTPSTLALFLDAYWGAANNEVFVPTGISVSTGTWHHIAVRKTTFSAGTQMGVDFFLDGSKVFSSATNLHNVDIQISNPNSLALGASSFASAPWVGLMDDTRISQVARTDAEISESFWRGILDTSRPTSPRFQQLTSQAWQQYLSALATTQMQQPVGAAINMAFASQLDYAADRLRMALKAKFPGLAPPDGLTQIGAERGMPQGQSETNAAYSARLLDAWNAWPWAGTAFGLLRAFYATGYTNVLLGQPNGGQVFTLDNGAQNLLLWSSTFNNTAGWATSHSSIVPGATTAPDGTTTAAKLVEDNATNIHRIFNASFSATIGLQYTASIYVKPSGRSRVQLFLGSTAFSSSSAAIFDLSGGTVVSAGAGNTATISAQPNGFFRLSVTTTANASGNGDIVVDLDNGSGTGYLGDGASGAYLWQGQVEQSTFAGPVSQTYSVAKTTALAAGSLLTSTESNGIWQNAPLSSPYTAPYKQTFWSQFDVVFPLPLNPATFSWAGGVPASNSAESNFIRALVQAWKPGHATCKSIVIIQQGGVWGYPTSGTWGETGDKWGSDTTTVWTP